MARNTLLNESLPHDQQLANAAYLKALEYRRSGTPFAEAYARAASEVSVGDKTKSGNPASHVFLARARNFAVQHNLSELDGQVAFARTEAGNRLYKQI